MGIVFWQWMATLLVALVGYPLTYIAIRSAIKERQSHKEREHKA